MKVNVLFPADYFDIKTVDMDYKGEYDIASKMPEFQVILYNYDEYVAGGELKLYPKLFDEGKCLYRGWMLKPDKYKEFYNKLEDKGLKLINTPEMYELCHVFPNIYPQVEKFTPKIRVYKSGERINWSEIKTEFKRFFIKDFVKSVKGTNFPQYFDSSYSNDDLDIMVEKFIELRGNLYTGGIVVKEYVELAKHEGKTNEYRAFIMNKEIISISQNSEQSEIINRVPVDLLSKLLNIPSNFYTVDFAELESGDFVLIETGDGQVSGLSPNQSACKFYKKLSCLN